MRFCSFCERFLKAHDLYCASVPRSIETLQLALKEAGFTPVQAGHLMSSLALWVGFSSGEKDLGPLLNVHYISTVSWWLRLLYRFEAWNKGLAYSEFPLPTLRSYD